MKYIIFNYYIYYFNLFYIDGKETHIGWERNEYRCWERNINSVGRKRIQGVKEVHTRWEGNAYTHRQY